MVDLSSYVTPTLSAIAAIFGASAIWHSRFLLNKTATKKNLDDFQISQNKNWLEAQNTISNMQNTISRLQVAVFKCEEEKVELIVQNIKLKSAVQT